MVHLHLTVERNFFVDPQSFSLHAVSVSLAVWISSIWLKKIWIQVAGYCEKVASIQDKRSVLYHSFEEALLKLKANKDTGAFQSAAKKIGGEIE